MNNIVCIYPKDKTTDFLIPIYEEILKLGNVVDYRVTTNEDGYISEILKSIKREFNENNTLIIFMGHGSSSVLYGIIDNNGYKTTLFDKETNAHKDVRNNIIEIKKYPIFCLSCQSKEFLKGAIDNYIGFGMIDTDNQEDVSFDFGFDFETITIKELNDKLSEVSGSDKIVIEDWIKIKYIRKTLVNIMVETIKYTRCSSLENMYKILKFYINKAISTLLIEKPIEIYKEIGDFLYDFYKDLEYYGVQK